MRFFILFIVLGCSVSARLAQAQPSPDVVLVQQQQGHWAVGEWIPPTADALLKIDYTDSGQLKVYLVRPRNAGQRDEKNPDPMLRSRLLIDIPLSEGFVFDTDHWANGNLYDPKTGNRYKCTIQYLDFDHINVTCHVGIGLFGKSMIWERKSRFIQNALVMLDLDARHQEYLDDLVGSANE